MAQEKYPFEEYTRVVWVPGADAITDLDSPTVGEIQETVGAVDITCYLTKDGLNPGGTTNAVDSGSLCNRIDSQKAGSVGYSFMLRGFRYEDDDAFWDIAIWGTSGYLVVRRGPAHDAAWAAAQKVEVYKAQLGEPIPAPSAANTLQTFELSLFIENAELKATVAAGS